MGNPKVGDFDMALGVQEEIGRFYIAVYYPLVMYWQKGVKLTAVRGERETDER